MARVDKFNKEIKKIIDNTTTTRISENLAYKIIQRGANQVISIPKSVSHSWLECKMIIREKSQLDSWNVEYSDTAIDALLVDFVFKIKHTIPTPNLQREVKLWFEILKNSTVETYIILRPVYNLITDLVLDFGRVKIQRMTQQVISSLSVIPQNDIITPQTVSDRLRNVATTDMFAIIEVKAKDGGHAEIMSQQYLERALNVIRITHEGTKVTGIENYCPMLHRPEYYKTQNSNQFTQGIHNVHDNIQTQISTTSLSTIQPVWDPLVSFLFEDNLNEIESTILSALYWFGEGHKDSNSTSSFLNYVTVIENLIIFDRQHDKAERVAERLSVIAYTDEENREKARVYMKKYYEIRNEIIHAGQTRVNAEDVSQVKTWALVLLQLFIRKHDSYQTISDLLQSEYNISFIRTNRFSWFRKFIAFFKGDT